MSIQVPPIKTQGIKTKLVPLILDATSNVDFDTWIEPFMGSGVVGFNVRPKIAIFSDTNPYLIDFYNAIKHGVITSEKAGLFLQEEGEKLAKLDDKYYYEVRDRFNDSHNPLDFLFLNRACFNGMIRFNKKGQFNVPYGHKPERFARAYITKIKNQIKAVEQCLSVYNWSFVCQSFETAIEDSPDNSFIYCDPPYIGRHTDYFDSWNETQEKLLHDILVSRGNKFALSTWKETKFRKNEYLETLWSGFNCLTREHFYHVGAKEVNRNSVIEALILNFELLKKITVQTE